MKFEGTWLVTIILSIGILAIGELEQSNGLIFSGSFVFVLAVLCEISSLAIHYINKQNKR